MSLWMVGRDIWIFIKKKEIKIRLKVGKRGKGEVFTGVNNLILETREGAKISFF